MKSQLTLLALLSTLAVPAFAGDAAAQTAKQVIPLADGSTLYVFKDGLMAKESHYGTAVRQEVGMEVKTKDGRTVTITSDEVARLYSLLNEGHGG